MGQNYIKTQQNFLRSRKIVSWFILSKSVTQLKDHVKLQLPVDIYLLKVNNVTKRQCIKSLQS